MKPITDLKSLPLPPFKPFVVGVAVVSVFVTTAAFAVEAPYSENFDSYRTGSTPNNFSTMTKGLVISSQWAIQNPEGTAGVYENFNAGDDALTSAAVNVTNLPNSDFILSTNFVLNSYGQIQPLLADINVGLGALGSTPDFSSSGYRFSYEVFASGPDTPTGSLELFKGGLFLLGQPSAILPVRLGDTYTMTLMGNYTPSGLVLTGILTDGNSSISIMATDASPLQGSYFGYYDQAAGAFNHPVSLDVSYDNFSVTVPEPRVTWFLGLGFAIVGICKMSREQIQTVLKPTTRR
jgi:hypothetical protein